MKTEERGRDTSGVCSGANSREEGRIRAIRNNEGVVKKEEENFERVGTKIEVVAQKSKREKVNTNIECERGRKI